jgi:hypothetical protein
LKSAELPIVTAPIQSQVPGEAQDDRKRSAAIAGQAARCGDGVRTLGPLGDPVTRVADEPYDGTERTGERTSGELQAFGEGFGAQLSGAPDIELESVGIDRRHGLPIGTWKLLIEAVRHDLAPSWEKEVSPRLTAAVTMCSFQFDVVNPDFWFHLKHSSTSSSHLIRHCLGFLDICHRPREGR